MKLRQITDHDLILLFRDVWSAIFITGNYGMRDFETLVYATNELERRGYKMTDDPNDSRPYYEKREKGVNEK